MLIYIIGLIDDIKGLKASHKFLIQTIAALIFPLCNLMINNLHGLFGLYELPLWASYPLTVFVILLIVNAMNLIDGIDGLSSSLSIIMLLVFAFLFHQLNAPLFVLLSVSLTGALIGFFYYNYYGRIGKNKIFMGDTGSLFIGFVIAYLAIKYQMKGWVNITNGDATLLTSITLVFIPCIDVTRVALTRLFKGKKDVCPRPDPHTSYYHADGTDHASRPIHHHNIIYCDRNIKLGTLCKQCKYQLDIPYRYINILYIYLERKKNREKPNKSLQ